MKEKAYAKINLCLDVVKRREDGYHELNMVMAPIDFYDTVELTIAKKMSFKTNAGYLALDEKNTVIKTIKVMREEFAFKENFAIALHKQIPAQAGLAGGSSDGAAALRIIQRLLNLDISEEKQIQIAKKIGADVPFCLKSKPALVRGIGEKLEHFSFQSQFHVFLVKPHHGVSTKLAFESLNLTKCCHPDVLNMKKALIQQDYPHIVKTLGNSLEESAFRLVPQIKQIKEELLNFGFDGVLMSGSGSTVFALTSSDDLIQKATHEFKSRGYFVRKTRILSE